MDKSFREVVRSAQRGTGALTHAQRVTRMYRRSLRLSLDWAVERETFYIMAAEIRGKFDEAKALAPASPQVTVLMREGEAELVAMTHPDSYVLPTMPGGSKFMRNPPPPLAAVFPEGIPEEADIAAQTVEGVQVPMSANPEGYEKVLVVPYRKRAE